MIVFAALAWAAAVMQPEVGVALPPHRGKLHETLASPIDFSFQATGRLEDVQICIADVVSVVGAPVVLQNGRDRLVIASYSQGTFMAAVSLAQQRELVTAEIRVRGGGWDGRIASRTRSCFNAPAAPNPVE
jgi:hypothetical protein